MKIGIQTWGTEGDVRPFIALASGLSAARHDVTLAITEIRNKQFTPYGERLGFSIRHVGHIDIDEARFKALAAEVFRAWSPVRKGDILVRNFFEPVIEDMLDAAKTLCAENDLVIGHFFVYPMKIAALQQQRPFVMVFTTPLIPSRYVPPLGVPQLAAWMNLVWWKGFDVALNIAWKPTIDRLYRREGVQPEGSVFYDIWNSSLLNLVSVSPALFPPPPDWERRYRMCGFFNIPEHGEPWQMPPDLKEFLDSGAPPVYMTFGSMLAGEQQPREIVDILIEAARMAGCRAIIQANWDEVRDLPESPDIYCMICAPHRHIFPYCAAVVHHGGAGTTQAATIAGVPSIVVEHSSDQPLWGSLLHRMSIAPKLLHRRSLKASKLAQAIKVVLNTPAMKVKAGQIGARMQQEDGVARAIEWIEQYAMNDKRDDA
jgi:sterol 3beta-glucosyltransferase/vancomycin aglycone glucosyltransferase